MFSAGIPGTGTLLGDIPGENGIVGSYDIVKINFNDVSTMTE